MLYWYNSTNTDAAREAPALVYLLYWYKSTNKTQLEKHRLALERKEALEALEFTCFTGTKAQLLTMLEKHRLALERKEALEALRQEKLRGAEQLRQDKLRQLRQRRENFQCHMDERLRRARALRQAYVLEKQLKAHKEHSKVHGVKQEIAFIELLNAESKTYELQHRLESAEARRYAYVLS